MFISFPEITDLFVEGMEEITFPKMMKIEQKYDDSFIKDIPSHIQKQLELNVKLDDFNGKRICITAGSRGIPNLDLIIKELCANLKRWGAKPFVIPAMGSHGGGTAEGQRELLEGYGITEEQIGVPVLSSMEVVQYGTLHDGTPLYCDRYAMESDGIVILNKVKPHTDFRNIHESGLAKMIMIGLGKQKGASAIHMHGFAHFPWMLEETVEIFLKRAPVAFCVGLVQNAYDQISDIKISPVDQLMEVDAELLVKAKQLLPRFKFDNVDVLIIDEIGKNISGYGFDPNVIGRSNSTKYGVNDPIAIKRLVIRGLTEESHHNGSGIVAADITTRKCLNSINWSETWVNLITSTEIQGTKIPMYANNDRSAISLAIRCCSGIDRSKIKIARIKNSLRMHEIMVSEALYHEIKGRGDVRRIGEPFELLFDAQGNLIN